MILGYFATNMSNLCFYKIFQSGGHGVLEYWSIGVLIKESRH